MHIEMCIRGTVLGMQFMADEHMKQRAAYLAAALVNLV